MSRFSEIKKVVINNTKPVPPTPILNIGQDVGMPSNKIARVFVEPLKDRVGKRLYGAEVRQPSGIPITGMVIDPSKAPELFYITTQGVSKFIRVGGFSVFRGNPNDRAVTLYANKKVVDNTLTLIKTIKQYHTKFDKTKTEEAKKWLTATAKQEGWKFKNETETDTQTLLTTYITQRNNPSTGNKPTIPITNTTPEYWAPINLKNRQAIQIKKLNVKALVTQQPETTRNDPQEIRVYGDIPT